MSQILVISPHPDDETLGCGGTLLRHKKQGDTINWLIVTGMKSEDGYTEQQMKNRREEIAKVADEYGVECLLNLELPTTRLDTVPMTRIVSSIGEFFSKVKPEIVYLPFPGDVHSDHAVVFRAASACTKWFRYPSVKKVMAYEVLSETEFGVNPVEKQFQPQVFVDITPYLEDKIRIMRIFSGEMGSFPFPRSEEAIRSLAHFRGTTAGIQAAEAFALIRETV